MVQTVDVVIQPIGRTPGVLEPPLAKYQPQIVVLITSHQEFADITIEHIEYKWRKHVRRVPHVIVKIVETPWTADAVDRYMTALDEAVEEVKNHPETQSRNQLACWHCWRDEFDGDWIGFECLHPSFPRLWFS